MFIMNLAVVPIMMIKISSSRRQAIRRRRRNGCKEMIPVFRGYLSIPVLASVLIKLLLYRHLYCLSIAPHSASFTYLSFEPCVQCFWGIRSVMMITTCQCMAGKGLALCQSLHMWGVFSIKNIADEFLTCGWLACYWKYCKSEIT